MSLTREQFVELHKDREYIKTPERLQEIYSILGSNENVTEYIKLIDEDTFEPCLGFTDKTTGKRYMVKLELQQYINARMTNKEEE